MNFLPTSPRTFDQELDLAKKKAGRAALHLSQARQNTDHAAEVKAFKEACDELNRVREAWCSYTGFYGPGVR